MFVMCMIYLKQKVFKFITHGVKKFLGYFIVNVYVFTKTSTVMCLIFLI